MRFLVDANLSPKIAVALSKAGLESVHVSDAGLLTAPDRTILEYAAANDLVIVSADSDFGELLAANPPAVADDLEAGAVVTIARGRMRVRPLPIVPAD